MTDNEVVGITANTAHLRGIVERSIEITALNPYVRAALRFLRTRTDEHRVDAGRIVA